MPDLWRVAVERVKQDPVPAVTLRVQAVHPDAGLFPRTKLFALRLLADSVPGGPVTADSLTEESAGGAVTSVEVSDVRNSPFDEAAALRGVERTLRDRGLDPGDRDTWDRAFGEEWAAFWDDPARVPSARYAIRLTSPKWLRNVRPSSGWDSTAYG
ncbi:hypothetical protein ABZ410_00135 [Streptomyces cinnamoneus]|uniref:hypothetical protein n=1 Tax=Streptomyces cinnamoneus TaxID=53446 RepID=UPI0033CB7BB5